MLAACAFAAIILTLGADAQLPVQIRFADASAQSQLDAELVGLAQGRLEYQASGQRHTAKLEELSQIRFSDAQPLETAGIEFRVRLIDQSVIPCRSVRSAGNTTVLSTAVSRAIECPTKLISAIQIGVLDEAETAAWQKLSENELTADILVLRRPGSKLERIEGIVLKIDGEAVEFDFSGQVITVPLNKLAGLRTFTTQRAEPATALARITDTSGHVWPVADPAAMSINLTADSSSLELTLAVGLKVAFPADNVQRLDLDFGAGRTLYLTELEGTFSSPEEPFGIGESLTPSAALGPKNFTYTPPDSRQQIPSLLFSGGGSATYRIPEGFTQLTGDVLLAPSGPYTSPCRVMVRLDNQSIWEARVSPAEPSAKIDLELKPDQRLELVVEPQGKEPVGAAVLMRGLRLLK